MALPVKVHDPDAFLDYPSDWSEWLPEGDTIANVEMVVDDGVIVASTGINVEGTICYAWLSLDEPTIDRKYRVTFRITTAEGRVDDRSMALQARER